MIKLQETITKHGYIYHQLERTDEFAIYSQEQNNRCVGYEVFLIQKNKTHTFPNGAVYEAHETIPGDEQFGKTAWAFSKKDIALEKYNSLAKDGIAKVKATKKAIKIIDGDNWKLSIYKTAGIYSAIYIIDGKIRSPKNRLIEITGIEDKTIKELSEIVAKGK